MTQRHKRHRQTESKQSEAEIKQPVNPSQRQKSRQKRHKVNSHHVPSISLSADVIQTDKNIQHYRTDRVEHLSKSKDIVLKYWCGKSQSQSLKVSGVLEVTLSLFFKC